MLTLAPSLRLDDLPLADAARVRVLLGAVKWLEAKISPTKHMAEAAEAATARVAGLCNADGSPSPAARPISKKTMERYYYAWKGGKKNKKGRKVAEPGTWQCLLDDRVTAANRKEVRTAQPCFRAFLARLYAKHRAAAMSAIRELYDLWENCQSIPGYEGLNYARGMSHPEGWSTENLLRCMPRARSMKLLREGVRAANAEDMPHMLTTRAGGWPCCEVYFDDVWLDFYALGYNEAGTYQAARPLQLGCLDGYTGRRLCWGTKLRTTQPDGKHSVGLKAEEMIFLLCDYLANVGYSPRGTVLVMEHGTAHLPERIKEKLFIMTDGLIRVEEGAIQGAEQPGSVFGGSTGGNPRRKARLEEWHSIQRNYMDAIPSYSGHDRKEPETLQPLLKYQEKLIKESEKLALTEDQREYLLPVLPSLADVTNLLARVVTAINCRTEHAMEGWEACGFTVQEFAADGRTGWCPLAKLDTHTREFALACAARGTRQFRARRMSPQEAWELSTTQPGNELIRFTPQQVVELMSAFKPEPLPKVRGGFFHLKAKSLYHEELIYQARVITCDGMQRELPLYEKGKSFFYFFNPSDQACYVQDERGVVWGRAILYNRAPMVDEVAKAKAMGQAERRRAERLAQARAIVAPELAEQEITRLHNAAVLDGAPVDELGRLDAAHMRRIGSRKAAPPAPALVDSLPAEEFAGFGLPDGYDEPTFL